MSRVLAELMGATEPAFRAQLMRLEQAAGLPGADIRLMMHVINETRSKIRELGLDPHDTTGPELYAALQARLLADEKRVREALGISTDASAVDVLDSVRTFLKSSPLNSKSFVVKSSVMRQLLKKLQPKSTMKKLGYRSLDSMIKHEPVAQVLAAAQVYESRDWHHHRLDAYKKLHPSDFESKAISFSVPTTKQWPAIASKYVALHKHNLLKVSELGSVVMLPIEQDLPALTITTILLALNAVNDIRSNGSFLKLQQVRPDFGKIFAASVLHEPITEAELAGEALPWKLVQWFYGHGHSAFHPEAFEPHVQAEDLAWNEPEAILGELHPALEFWQGGQLLALLDDGNPVSLNLLDVALSACNGLEYSQRVIHHMREHLGRELMARYLHQENLQALLLGKLDLQLAPDVAYGVE